MSISLTLYLKNSESVSVTLYTLENFIPDELYIGRRRDEVDLLVIRKFIEGNALIKNPEDFDAIEDYIFTPQKALMSDGTNNYQCIVYFNDPDYFSKKVYISFEIIDKYSKLIEGIVWESLYEGDFTPVPTIEKKVNESKMNISQEYYYTIESSANLDDGLDGTFWGIETYSFSETGLFMESIIEEINKEKASEIDEQIDLLSAFMPNAGLMNLYYKPYYVTYSDYNIGLNIYTSVSGSYVREFRYFEETIEPPEKWHKEVPYITKTNNGMTYYKYVKEYCLNQMPFTGKKVYTIEKTIPGSTLYLRFGAKNEDDRFFDKYIQLNYLLDELFENHWPNDIDVSEHMYVTTANNYNGSYVPGEFQLKNVLQYIRKKFSLYYYLGTNNDYSIKYLNFNTKLLDVNDYVGNDFLPVKKVSFTAPKKRYIFASDSYNLDFKTQNVSFAGASIEEETISEGCITDLETQSVSKTENILIHANEKWYNLLNQKWLVSNTNSEGLMASEDGQSISWFDGQIIDVTIESERFYPGEDQVRLQYDLTMYGTGEVYVAISRDYEAYHSSSAFVNQLVDIDGATEEGRQLRIDITGSGSGFNGYINVNLTGKILRPVENVCKISGAQKLNGSLSNANIIVNNKPLMSLKKGYLDKYGIIDCEPNYSKEITFKVPLNEDLFGWDMDHYVEMDSEKFIIFEEKRKILDEETISEYTEIKARSNELI